MVGDPRLPLNAGDTNPNHVLQLRFPLIRKSDWSKNHESKRR